MEAKEINREKFEDNVNWTFNQRNKLKGKQIKMKLRNKVIKQNFRHTRINNILFNEKREYEAIARERLADVRRKQKKEERRDNIENID